MPKETKAVRKNMRLRQDLIDRARQVLGTRTETETVEQAQNSSPSERKWRRGSVASLDRAASATSTPKKRKWPGM